MKKIDKFSDKDFTDVIKSSCSIKEVLHKLGYSENNYNMSKYINERMKSTNVALLKKNNSTRITDDVVYTKNSNYNSDLNLRAKNDNFMKYECSSCGNDGKWCNKKLTLQIHHIDGDFKNNEKSNLTWLCPNCHTQTENYGSKNSRRKEKRHRFSLKVCPVCNNKFIPNRRGQEICSTRCVSINNKKNPPISKQELKQYLESNSFSGVGRIFNVSDNTIRNWCKKYNMPINYKNYKNN